MLLLSYSYIHGAEIHTAVESGNLAKVQQLITANPNLVNAVDDSGVTPLHFAAGLNNTNIVTFLISKGANIMAVTKQGWTPLHWAAHMNSADVVSQLIARGANPTAKALDGKTPHQVAVAENAQDVIAALAKTTSVVYTDKALEGSYQLAKNAMTKGDLKQAYELYGKLVSEDPGNANYNFGYGMTCLLLKEFSRGQLAFERVLARDPQNGRARLELARCYMGLGQDTQARREFEAVLQSNPQAEVKRNIEAYLAEINRRTRKWQFVGRADFMMFHDDNVNVGPDSLQISIAPVIFGTLVFDKLDVQNESQPADSFGYGTMLMGSAVYDAGNPGKWAWGNTAAYYKNWLVDRDQNESLFGQVDTGPKYLFERTFFDMPMRLAHISTGGESLVSMYGIHPAFMYIYGPAGEWRFGTLSTLERRDYSTLDDRDGFYMSIGEMARYYFGEKRHNIMMGLALSHDFTSEAVYEYNGIEWVLGGEWKLPWEMIAYGRIRYCKSSYEEREVLAPSDRKDTQTQMSVGLSKKITPFWGVDANYQDTDNSSTFTLYQYDRHIVTLGTYVTF